MMENKKYLTEENYEKGKKKLKAIALTILVIGILIGGSLIATGLIKQSKVNSQYSEENKISVSQQLETEKQNLVNKKNELEAKGVKYKAYAKYTDGEVYDLYVITKALDPSFDYCAFDECKNNGLTSKYCSLKNNLKDINSDFNKNFDSSDNIPFYMFGVFAILASFIFSGYVYFISKGREIAAFTTQQAMPIAKEGIDEMAPTIGNAAKEIAKGIKKGLKDEEK